MTIRFTIAVLFLLASQFAGAQQIDPLWKRAQDIVLASKNLVAGDVSVDTFVVDDEGSAIDTIHKTTSLTQWKGDQPVRTVLKTTEAKQSGLGELKFEWGVSNHPEQGLMDGKVVRGEKTIIDDKVCVIFYVDGKKGKQPFKSTAWIEEATGLPLKADYVIDGIPLTKSLTYSVLFGRDESARWLPQEVTINAFISAVFYKFKINSKQRFTRWIARPTTPN